MARARSVRLRLLGATALGLITFAAGAHAQEVEETQVDEIIVTAQHRAQNPIEVPFALTAYNGAFLEDLGIEEFDQLSAHVPGFLVQNQSPNNPGFVMRGITSDSGAATAEPRVSVYQDGVSISRSRGSYVELFDLERVEVAKGPQSTLYGRGALIGAVNLVQNRASLGGVAAEGRISMGDEGYTLVEGMVNIPASDDFALRLAGRIKHRDGYIDNLLGGDDYGSISTEAFRVLAAWEQMEGLRADLILNHQSDRASGTPFTSMAYAPTNPLTGARLGPIDPFAGAALTPGAAFDGGQELGLDREVWGATGLIEWTLSDALTLNSTSAYRRFSSYEVFDADGVSLPILTAAEEAAGEQWSQELRLGIDTGGRLTGFVGAGWFQEEGYQRVPTQFDERIALAQLSGVLNGGVPGGGLLPTAAYPTVAQSILTQLLTGLGAGPGAPVLAAAITPNLSAAHTETSTNSSDLTSLDLFGDATFAVSDRLELSAGLRYTRDDKTTGYAASVDNGRSTLGTLLAIQQGAIPAAQIPTFLSLLSAPNYTSRPGVPLFALQAQPTVNNGDFVYADHEDSGLTWRLTARYAVSDDVSLYANYARGRRPEVLSVSGPAAPLGAPTFTVVEAETVDSFEVGAKSALMDRRLRLEGALFFYDYQNFQTTIQQGTRFVVTNAGEATSYGLEAQAFFAATPNLDLFATYGFNHSRFGNGLYEGNSFRLSPDHMVSIGAQWRIPVSGGEIEIQPSYTWQSRIFFDDNNDIPALQVQNLVPDQIQDELQGSYGLLSLRVRYERDHGGWGIELFGDNLLDEEYIKDAGNTGDSLGMPTFIPGRGSTWGAALTARF